MDRLELGRGREALQRARGPVCTPVPKHPELRAAGPLTFQVARAERRCRGRRQLQSCDNHETCPAAPGPTSPTGHHHRLPRLLHGRTRSLGPQQQRLSGHRPRAPPGRPAPPPKRWACAATPRSRPRAAARARRGPKRAATLSTQRPGHALSMATPL